MYLAFVAYVQRQAAAILAAADMFSWLVSGTDMAQPFTSVLQDTVRPDIAFDPNPVSNMQAWIDNAKTYVY